MTRSVPPEQLLKLAGDVISRGGHFTFQAAGHSMFPAIVHGDRVVLGPLHADGARVGDVVLTETGSGPRLHRVVSIETGSSGSLLVVRGDADPGPGERVEAKTVCGRVIRVHRSLRLYLSPRFWAATLRRILTRISS